MSGRPLMERNFKTAKDLLALNVKNGKSTKNWAQTKSDNLKRTYNQPYTRPQYYKKQKVSDSDEETERPKQEEKEIEKKEPPRVVKPFVPPYKKPSSSQKTNDSDEEGGGEISSEVEEILKHPKAKNLDAKIVDRILNEIIERTEGKKISWSDIAGLKAAKESIREIVILPMLKPQLFVGLRAPSKGLLLFGPPGTGKTLIGKCIASQCGSTFFSISASSLTSKWIGQGEKLVRALFAIARIKQPSVIFIDEIDSLLTQRNDTEHESSRRLKTEFLVQFDGLNTDQEERLLVIGATNRPHELDEAARRRFSKRLYIPLPNRQARGDLIKRLIKDEKHTLTNDDLEGLCRLTQGYSGADICCLCAEAAYGPIRRVMPDLETYDTKESLPPITFDDFSAALETVKATVAQSDLTNYVDWNKKYGSGAKKDELEDQD